LPAKIGLKKASGWETLKSWKRIQQRATASQAAKKQGPTTSAPRPNICVTFIGQKTSESQPQAMAPYHI
jgi:hypothetical protein